MKVSIPRLIATAFFVAATGWTAFAEDYQCWSSSCSATRTMDGEVQTVTFRKGDIVSTDSGWTVNTNNGWHKIRPTGNAFAGFTNI